MRIPMALGAGILLVAAASAFASSLPGVVTGDGMPSAGVIERVLLQAPGLAVMAWIVNRFLAHLATEGEADRASGEATRSAMVSLGEVVADLRSTVDRSGACRLVHGPAPPRGDGTLG